MLAKVHNLTVLTERGDAYAFYFKPATDKGKTVYPRFEGLMDQEAFDKAY